MPACACCLMNPIGVGDSKLITVGSLEHGACAKPTTWGFTHFQSQCRYDPDKSSCSPSTGTAVISTSTPDTLASPAFWGSAQGPPPPYCGQLVSTSCASLKSL